MIPFIVFSACSCLCSQAVQAGLELPSNFLDEFTSSDATLLLNEMKNCFHVAGTVSPLVILNPSKWAELSMGRDHLLTVRILCCSELFLTILHRYFMHWGMNVLQACVRSRKISGPPSGTLRVAPPPSRSLGLFWTDTFSSNNDGKLRASQT